MITDEQIETAVRSIQVGCQKFPDNISIVVVIIDHDEGHIAVTAPEGIDTKELLKAALESVEDYQPDVTKTLEPLD